MKKLFKNIFLAISFLGFVFIQSCTKDEDNTDDGKSYKLVKELRIEESKNLFTLLGQQELINNVSYTVNVYEYTYLMNYKGEEIEASGLLCVPNAPGKEFPVLSFQHGTIVAHSEAPSVDYQGVLNRGVEAIASMGYVVLIPDEIGFGSSSNHFHPYLVKEQIANSVIEMINSINEYPDGEFVGVTFSDSLFLMGYSHGGWATMATLEELELSNNNSWNVIAAASGAGPYSPELVREYSLSTEQYSHQYYMSYVLLSYIDAGLISNPLSDFYNEPYASKINDLHNGTLSGSQINEQLTNVNANLYTAEFINNYPEGKFADLKAVLDQNSVPAWNTTTPIMLTHGGSDTSIPQIVSDQMYQDFIAIGAENVDYHVIPFADHVGGAIPSLSMTLVWFQGFR